MSAVSSLRRSPLLGGRQRSAAELLGILPSTLREKMSRLGIKRLRIHQSLAPAGPEVAAALQWRGSLPPGGILELRGLNGPGRVVGRDSEQLEVSAARKGPRALLAAIEIKIVEHGRGVTVCAVCHGLGSAPSRGVERRVSRGAHCGRVELVARVPPGTQVKASTVNDDIEIVGLASGVGAETVNGRVRLLTAAPLPQRENRAPAPDDAS